MNQDERKRVFKEEFHRQKQGLPKEKYAQRLNENAWEEKIMAKNAKVLGGLQGFPDWLKPDRKVP